MKLCKMIMSLVIMVSIILCNLNISANAATISVSESNVSPYRVIYHPITFDQYSDAIFSSIDAAKDTFGWDYTYQQTYHYYQGVVYNWYYGFSDGTKQFFRVINLGYDDTTSIVPEGTNK